MSQLRKPAPKNYVIHNSKLLSVKMPSASSSPIKLSIQNKLNIGVAKMTAPRQDHASSSQPVSGTFHFWIGLVPNSLGSQRDKGVVILV